MSSYNKKKRRQKHEMQNQFTRPWISMKTGRRVIWMISIALALFIAWQVIPQRGVAEGILWGLIFGGAIWLVFEGHNLLYRFLRRIRTKG